jgi:methionyl-tRNA formyltransferase
MKDVLLLADGAVGASCVDWLLANHRADIGLVVTTADNAISAAARQAGVATATFENSEQLAAHIGERGLEPDLGLLLWWPRIIKPPLIGLPNIGFVNTHPSLLPYNRGKHYNFWAIVEQAPFGVTLHRVDEGVDTGPILAQMPLEHGWEDTGETLYLRARAAMIDLVKASYPALRDGALTPRPRDAAQGSFHKASELEPASRIALDAPTTARDLLNRLRARTFPGYPGCRFEEDGRTYEVTVSIKDVT